MATTTAQQPIEVAPRSKAPLGAWVAVPGISGPSKRNSAFLARLAENVMESLTEVGLPTLGSRHPGSFSTREKAPIGRERIWASAYFMGFMAPF